MHASQGVTVDHCYVANLRGMGRESTYVAMTRHRQTARLYADTSRIRDRLEANQPGRMLTGKQQTTTLELEDRSAGVSDAEVRKALMDEVKRSDLKMNPSDFVADIRQFVAAPPAITEPALAFVDGKRVAPQVAAVEAEQAEPAPAEQMKDRMKARMNSLAEYPVPPANSPAINVRQTPGRVAQFDKMMVETQNLLKVATQHLGGNLLRSWNSNRNHEVQFGDRAKVQISKSERTGRWSWSTIADTTKRGVADLVAKVRDIPSPQEIAWLRDRTRRAMVNPISQALESSPTEIARRRHGLIIGKTPVAKVEKSKAPDRGRGSYRDDGLSM